MDRIKRSFVILSYSGVAWLQVNLTYRNQLPGKYSKLVYRDATGVDLEWVI